MSNYTLKKINNHTIAPIEVPSFDPDKIKGYDIFPLLYGTMFIAAKKGSGKTNVVYELMKNCINKSTVVIVFCATHNSDFNWQYIKKWLEDREQPHKFFTNIFEDGVDNVQSLVDAIKQMHEQENANKKIKKKKDPKPLFDLFGDVAKEETQVKEVKSKKKAPDYFIILDDISGELRTKKAVQLLLKAHRHYRTKVIISSQFPSDLDPASRAQIDIWLLFKGFAKDKLETIFPGLDLRDLEFEQFYDMYKYATTKPHSFLYIDRNSGTFRKNLNEEIIFPHNQNEE